MNVLIIDCIAHVRMNLHVTEEYMTVSGVSGAINTILVLEIQRRGVLEI